MRRRKLQSDERGIAIVLALFMVMVVSVLSTSLMFVSQTETLSSRNYRTTSQARYAAESGIHKTAHHLLYQYTPPGSLGDPLTNYDMTKSPVEYDGKAVVLSSDPDVASNYPVPAVEAAFATATTGTLAVTNGTVNYRATATLLSMQQIVDTYSQQLVTLQTWQIDGAGSVPGVNDTEVEVSAVIERQPSPVFKYAAFATYDGCAALSFDGGATTDSYDSSAPLVGGVPATSPTDGNVGTNGNLTQAGSNTTIHGSLSTPRAGVGNCTSNNVTAQTISGGATVDDGLVELSQAVKYPTPEAINPLPPTSASDFTKTNGCAALASGCVPSSNGATIYPHLSSTPGTVTLGNVSVGNQAELHLNAGTYIVNSFTMNSNSKIIVDSGPVIFKIAGQNVTQVVKITGQGISNPSFDPQNLQFVYGGTGDIEMAGGAETSALVYAPNATGKFTGGSDFYGAVILKQLTASGGASIHYDRRLRKSAVTAGNHVMSAFSWKSY